LAQLANAAAPVTAEFPQDPRTIGVALYHHRTPEDGPRDADGNLEMVSARLDIQVSLTEHP